MKNLILFSIIALTFTCLNATTTDSTAQDSTKTVMQKPTTNYYGDSAAIVKGGFYLKKSGECLTNALIFSAISGACIAIAPLTITTKTDPKTKVTTTEMGPAYFLYGVSGLCGLVSAVYTISAVQNLNKAGRAFQYRAYPNGVGVVFQF
jgi:hypothetical protein